MSLRRPLTTVLALVTLVTVTCAPAEPPKPAQQAPAAQPTAAQAVQPTATSAAKAPAAGPVQITEYFKEPRTVPYPKPWPLKNLIAPGTLTVGITAKTPPGSFTNAQGEFVGSRIDLWKRMAEDLGLKIKFERLDWPGILPGLQANKFDMACEGVSWSNERLSSGEFLLTRPIAVNATVAIVRKDSGITSWDQANGKKLGGVKGELYYETAKEVVKNPSALVEVPGRPEAMLALANRQMDVFAVDLTNGTDLIKKSPQGDQFTIIGPPLNLVTQGMCVNNREPDLLMAANILLTNYRVDGTLAKLEEKYFGTIDHVTLLSAFGY